jgi:hypothetical protein
VPASGIGIGIALLLREMLDVIRHVCVRLIAYCLLLIAGIAAKTTKRVPLREPGGSCIENQGRPRTVLQATGATCYVLLY